MLLLLQLYFSEKYNTYETKLHVVIIFLIQKNLKSHAFDKREWKYERSENITAVAVIAF